MIDTKKTFLTLSLWSAMTLSALAQGTAFTYQGQLNSGTNPASGNYDFQFALSNAPSGGVQIGGTLTNPGVGVTNGLFVTMLDFGPVFTGKPIWLAIAVRTNGGSGFTPLSPLQPITPTPYAVYSESANATNLVGTVQSANLSGVALLGAANNFTTDQTVQGQVVAAGSFGALTMQNRANSSQYWQWRADASGLNVFSPSLSQPMTIAGNGNVGIGTSAPTSALQVNGTVTASAFSGAGAGLTGVALLAGGNNFTGGTNTFGSSVGIGTTTPNSPLAVYGNIFMGKERNNTVFNQIGDTIYLGAEQKYLGNTLGVPVDGSTDWINLMANPLSAGIMFGLSTSSASPHSNIVPLMVIQPSGNVGIGVTNPGTALQVNGTVTANNFSGNGSGLTNLAGASVSGVALLSGGNALSGQQTFVSGNVGIGTTTPIAHLHVDGGAFETPAAAALFEVQNCGAACALPSWTEAVRLLNSEVNDVGLVGMGFLTATDGNSLTNVPDAWIGTDDKADGNTHSFQIATQSGGVLTNRVFINGATGNVGIGTNSPQNKLDVNGEINCTAINITSDRNAKQDFKSLNPRDVLAKVAALPITEWQYKADNKSRTTASRHLGPMAQDFSAAFALGHDDKHISIVDESGVALAAIQGLNQKLEETRAENAELRQSIQECKRMLEQLERNVPQN